MFFISGWSEAWVCGSSLAGTAGSDPADGMTICVFECCVLSGVRRSDPSSRGALPTVCVTEWLISCNSEWVEKDRLWREKEDGRKTFSVHELFAASAIFRLFCVLISNFGWFGDRISAGTRFSASVQTHYVARPNSSTIGAGCISWGQSSRSVALTTHPVNRQSYGIQVNL